MAKVILFIHQDRLNGNTNNVDDKSVQVGGQQSIITIDGYSMPLVCRGGLMYLKFQGIPIDKDLLTYPYVHLTSPQEWDPFVLDSVHPKDNGEPNSTYDSTEKFQVDPIFDEFDDVYPEDNGELDWNNEPTENFQSDPKFDEFDDYVNESLSITPQISSTNA